MISKYHNKKTVVDGIKFDSRKESLRYILLKAQQDEGIIRGLELQPKFELQPHFKYNGKIIRKIEYIADFAYFNNNGDYVVEDVKGVKTDVFKIKEKIFKYRYPDIIFKLV